MLESFRGKPYAINHFRQIVEFARHENPFYREWITDPENPPLLDRMTALAHNDKILNGHPVTGTTSGSISVPVRYSHSEQWRSLARRDVSRFVNTLGGEVSCARIIHTASEGDGPMTLNVTAPLDEQINFILRMRRDFAIIAITTLPTNADLLCQEIIDRGIDMSFITRFGTYAETLQDYQKELIRGAFPNARLWETYSSQEFGLIAFICPHEPDFYHLSAHRLGIEALRDDGTPAPPGEPGSVYITDYFNRNSPFIRYELGDLIVRGECPCGRFRLPAIRKILGRVSGTLRHRDGRRILFVDISIALREIPGVRQYKVIQDGIEDFTVKLSSKRNVDNEVRAVFETHLGYVPGNLSTEYLDVIPRDASGKYRTSVCNV